MGIELRCLWLFFFGFGGRSVSVKAMEVSVASGYVKIAIENDHRNSGFSHEKW